ncbi:hypothetical protein RclHR1_17710001 [Rhizophagus clarus]|uniref:RNase H type-1 domain-containing protein n=1 Tax=Rhizophagus clarus TaxID=94130 RepID=A0A2Z6QY20_9GLOM|nr:hypothetical protein RclHR1_17710001 [Rhizophagus clarus]
MVSGVTTNQKNRRWLVSLDDHAASLFGKQLTVQPKKDTCIIVHWTSDCLSSPGDVIRLHPCPGCDAHVPFPAATKYTAIEPRCTITVSLLRSLILPTDCERIWQSTTVVVSPYSWADLCDQVISYYNRLSIPPDFSSSPPMVDGKSTSSPLSRDSPGLPLPVILPPGSHYRYYTNGSLINLGSPEVTMGWAEIAAIYAALSVTPADSVISIYTDSQATIDSLRSFKGHDGNYWNEFADSLANSAHHPLPGHLYAGPFITYTLSFTFCLTDRDDYLIDWDFTWFALNYSPTHDASFQAHHASRHYTFKFKLFLDDLPLLEKLKITRPDLYIDLLTCRSCCNRKEDLMHLILCSKRRNVMHQIFQFYQNHLFSKLCEAGELADKDPTPMLRKLSSLSCWTISSSNWSSYALIRGCLSKLFIDLFIELSIPRVSAMKVVAAIHNNFIQKLRTRIWNLRTYDKSKWEDVMNITLKLKTSPQPSNLPATLYVPFSSLPPPTHLVTSRDSEANWIKNSMTQGLSWLNHLSGFMGCLTVLLNNSFCRMGCQFL